MLQRGGRDALHLDHDRGGRKVERFAARPTVLPFDQAIAAQAGGITAGLERQGRPIGPQDLLTAGHARSRGRIVITGNPGEVRRMEG